MAIPLTSPIPLVLSFLPPTSRRPPPSSHRPLLSPNSDSLLSQAPPFLQPIPLLGIQCMADPELDSGIEYDEEGRTDIYHSTFFDVGFGEDATVNDYIERITYTLSEAIEEHLPQGTWTIIGRAPSCSPNPAFLTKDDVLRATCLTVALLTLYKHTEGLASDLDTSNEMVAILQEKLEEKDRLLKKLLSQNEPKDEPNESNCDEKSDQETELVVET